MLRIIEICCEVTKLSTVRLGVDPEIVSPRRKEGKIIYRVIKQKGKETEEK